jgi:hypothetical protein
MDVEKLISLWDIDNDEEVEKVGYSNLNLTAITLTGIKFQIQKGYKIRLGSK